MPQFLLNQPPQADMSAADGMFAPFCKRVGICP